MDYEKKYKEALERAKEIIECSKSDTKEVRMVLSFFPELKESEDERIRKEIISMSDTLGRKDWIAWLEKRGEQKPLTPKEKLRSLSDGKRHLGWLDDAEKIVAEEQKPEWNEEDERIIDRLCEILYDCHSYGKCSLKLNEYSNLYDWLKSLKDRVLPHPKQEWSDEDKKLIDDTCHLINTLASGYGEKVTEPITFSGMHMIAIIKDRLRALIDNRPQTTWKQSESHIFALESVIDSHPFANPRTKESLQDLVKQLKAL